MPRKLALPRRDLDLRAPYALEINRRLHNPDATLGWSGAPDLYAGWNRLESRWEVHEVVGDNQTIVARMPTGERFDLTRLICGLVERDTHLRNHASITDAVIKANEDASRANSVVMEDATRLTLDKLYHQWARDDGHNHGYVAPISLHNPKR